MIPLTRLPTETDLRHVEAIEARAVALPQGFPELDAATADDRLRQLHALTTAHVALWLAPQLTLDEALAAMGDRVSSPLDEALRPVNPRFQDALVGEGLSPSVATLLNRWMQSHIVLALLQQRLRVVRLLARVDLPPPSDAHPAEGAPDSAGT